MNAVTASKTSAAPAIAPLREFVVQFGHLLDSAPSEKTIFDEDGALLRKWSRAMTGFPKHAHSRIPRTTSRVCSMQIRQSAFQSSASPGGRDNLRRCTITPSGD